MKTDRKVKCLRLFHGLIEKGSILKRNSVICESTGTGSVLGLELHHIAGYESGADFITCYEQERAHWRRVPVAATGCIAVFYRGEVPAHIGVMISPVKCLHARGEFGFVRCDSPLALLKVYSRVEYMIHGSI